MAQPRALSETEEAEIVKAYQANETTKALAARYGVHPDTIRNIAKRANLPMRGRGGISGVPRLSRVD